jgi:hypothetical protein
VQESFTNYPGKAIIPVMNKDDLNDESGTEPQDVDGYYGEDDMEMDDLDLSFLDEEEPGEAEDQQD